MKFAQFESECFGTFCEGFKSGSSLVFFFFLNVLYHSFPQFSETKVNAKGNNEFNEPLLFNWNGKMTSLTL